MEARENGDFMMSLINFEPLPGGNKLEYLVEHVTSGREGTTLTAHLWLYMRPDKSWCEMKIEDCVGADQKEALDRMAVWLRRLADGIEQRKDVSIPL